MRNKNSPNFRHELDYYNILGVSESASGEDIRRAYRRLVLDAHPDKNPHRREWAEHRIRLLIEAFDILGNDEKGSISRITKWALNKYQITITCVGVTYPQETYTIVGQVSPWVMYVEVRGKTEGDIWTRKLRLRPVKSVEREIALGREAARK